jgi:UDP-GlcNAc:undecaprenyl-phosphate/decaprenyl-phosphate GlcNAc-1-phosphate transferase
MNTLTLQLLLAVCLSIGNALVLFPVFIKISPVLGLVDLPDHRKLHHKPIPAIGGLVIILSIMGAALISKGMWQFIAQYKIVAGSILVLTLTGVVDDRRNLSVKARFMIQIICAYLAASNDVRITSFYGFMGIHEIPVILQYVITIIIITGVVNAYNLLDGINGLVGGISIINTLVLVGLCIYCGEEKWLFLLLPVCGTLLVFLYYNWRNAKAFIGDSGSLVMGFITVVTGIWLMNHIKPNSTISGALFVSLAVAICIIPVLDTLRVFRGRIKKGNSPFKADKSHLHHLLLNNVKVHEKATVNLLGLHIILVVFSLIAIHFFTLTQIIFLQALLVVGFINYVWIIGSFLKWYNYIKKMEAE